VALCVLAAYHDAMLAFWLFVLATVFVPVLPIIRILQRTGHSGWWVILYFLPVAGWVGIWIFAYARWPKVDPDAQIEVF